MGFFDDVWDDIQAPIRITENLAGGVVRAGETLAGGASNLASGVGKGIESSGSGIESLGKALNNPLFLIAVGGIALIILLK